MNEREIALNILLKVLEQGTFSHIAIREVLSSYPRLEKRQRAFITNLCQGVLEHKIELDYIIDSISKIKVNKMKPVIRNILRLSVYQMKYMDSVPDSAICNEAVKLANKRGFSSLRGFVNGVLRNVLRNIETIPYPVDSIQALVVQYSIPQWIIELWHKSYSIEVIKQICEGIQASKTITIRTNTEHITPTDLQASLQKQGYDVNIHPYLSYAFYLSGIDQIEHIPEFQSGDFYIQDVSSMLVSEVASPKEHMTCVDVCAAPGGKSLHIASMMHGTGKVYARDLTESKIRLIDENISRSTASNIGSQQWDARELDHTMIGHADLVIADLPCSGLGIIGKKADLRYNSSPDGIQSLVALQREILSVVHSYVKTGGSLIYSTCTINPSENIEQVQWFLEKFPEYKLVDLRPHLPEVLWKDVVDEGMLQLLPGVHQCDGFFIAKMDKVDI